MAIREAEAALKNKTFVIAERRRVRKKTVELFNETFNTDYFKNYRQVTKFNDFAEKIRTHSEDIIYDSDKAVDIFLEHPTENLKELMKRYREYEREFRSKSSPKTRF